MLHPHPLPEPHPNATAWGIAAGFLVIIPDSAAMLVICLRINGWL